MKHAAGDPVKTGVCGLRFVCVCVCRYRVCVRNRRRLGKVIEPPGFIISGSLCLEAQWRQSSRSGNTSDCTAMLRRDRHCSDTSVTSMYVWGVTTDPINSGSYQDIRIFIFWVSQLLIQCCHGSPDVLGDQHVWMECMCSSWAEVCRDPGDTTSKVSCCASYCFKNKDFTASVKVPVALPLKMSFSWKWKYGKSWKCLYCHNYAFTQRYTFTKKA